jgi:DivIVA domain-containing protein
MLEDRIALTTKDILEKEFKFDARGYRPQEVDKFLDLIMKDYTEYQNIIKKLAVEIKNLESENQSLQAEVRDLKSKLEIAASNSSKGVTNLDIIKRISELEKIVYGESEE